MLATGVMLLLASYLFHRLYFFDPVDIGLIIHEQALGLSSKFTSQNESLRFMNIIDVEEYVLMHVKTQRSHGSPVIKSVQKGTNLSDEKP